MTNIERKKMEALGREAKAIRDVWLREREEARAAQISANAEVRREWKESDDLLKATLSKTTYDFK